MVWRVTGPFILLEKAQLKVARAIVHSQHGQPGPEVLSEYNRPTLAWEEKGPLSVSLVHSV